ncbi:dienelactone hydrolase family protein [Cellvibrio sp. PSBB023]|uniref:dienelactone hydrolase family protein n=1 Tax=Cellvibrio sp. PSBB023 TaxID=1945512 RepID=UPI00098F7BCB|nr:dienelactone hydrolase family protein [Cellvibrio sp. PSBB023]AQT60987.1 dienelactone hydrolase [Cellvibrio sp. PSBB023]
MCDDLTLDDNQRYAQTHGQLNRRQFVAGMVGASLAMYLPLNANAMSVTESTVNVATPDGTADCYFVHPASGKYPAVILWPDILGLRPAFELMGKRLAQSGYAVLVVNPFYRTQKAPVVGPGASYEDEATRTAVTALAKTLSPATHVIDAKAFVSFLDQQAAVDSSKKIGTMGYCMSGSIAFRTAAALPQRVGAVASFHGGGLVNTTPDSPHLLIPKTQAQFLIAIAENDDQRDLEAKNVLRKSFADAKIKAEVEVYTGALHGWCPPDSRVYNQELAERAWSRLLVLFDERLV